MSKKVLFVDDEPNVLQSIKRNLRKGFDVDTAGGGEEALQKLASNDEYAVVVSDMRMPGMDGVEFLSKAKQQCPDTVRMMLTGNADQQTAVDAVNKGDVFRFLNKPCDAAALASAVTVGLRQYELITAEKHLLENTLRGSIKALADILALTNPELFGRTTRFKTKLAKIAEAMGLDHTWQFESAALLSQLGCVTLPAELVRRQSTGEPLAAEQLAEFSAHAKVGADLLSTIPRMEDVAQYIRYQGKNFDGTGFPEDNVKGEEIPLGARLLKVVIDFDAAESSGLSAGDAAQRLLQSPSKYDPAVIAALEKSVAQSSGLKTATVAINELTDSMVIAADVLTFDNVLLIAKGQETTLSTRRHLQSYKANGQIGDSVNVLLPA
ncbi:MAG: response regulator [Gammaproteobacteria bacterium]|nr:response regulator [Gammaproteobacteria bacterium]